MPRRRKFRLALLSWEIGRVNTGFGVKSGGLGAVLEELPEELITAGAKLGLDVVIEILTPCFGHYDRNALERLRLRLPAVLDGHRFYFEAYRKSVSDNLSIVYFWDDWQLNWTNSRVIYPSDPELGLKLFSTVSQAMAGYIRKNRFDTVHGHDYHVGLVPFYLGDGYLSRVPHHFTIHNASYQGVYPVGGRGYEKLAQIDLPGELLFHKYFDFFDNLNILKAVVIKTHERGGKVTTVSGDLRGSWGYAAELRQGHESLRKTALLQKPHGELLDVFVPNRHLDVLEHIPVVGITNGLGRKNWPQNLPELRADHLRELQLKLPPGAVLFRNPLVQEAMLARDHDFDLERLDVKGQLKRLLHLEAFNREPEAEVILIVVLGRLVEQKNLGLVADIMEPIFIQRPEVKVVILANAPEGDLDGKLTEDRFQRLAMLYRDRCFFSNEFNQPLSKLMLSGADFTLIPSRFEPCGLVDYEASLLGTVVIAHRTGGLAKIEKCGYLYDWLDQGDRAGEVEALLAKVLEATGVYRTARERHRELMRAAMSIGADWSASAEQYIRMYRSGLLMQDWGQRREVLLKSVDAEARKLLQKEPLFGEFFHPVPGDVIDLRLEDYFLARKEAALRRSSRKRSEKSVSADP